MGSRVVRDDVMRKDRRAARQVGVWMDIWSDETADRLNAKIENVCPTEFLPIWLISFNRGSNLELDLYCEI